MLLILYSYRSPQTFSTLTGKRVNNVTESAISEHLIQSACVIDFDHFYILASDTNKIRLFLKKILINKMFSGFGYYYQNIDYSIILV